VHNRECPHVDRLPVLNYTSDDVLKKKNSYVKKTLTKKPQQGAQNKKNPKK
jgi:hypothetical protein